MCGGGDTPILTSLTGLYFMYPAHVVEFCSDTSVSYLQSDCCVFCCAYLSPQHSHPQELLGSTQGIKAVVGCYRTLVTRAVMS